MFEIAIDETSSRRGHNYVTVVVDMTARRVVFVAENRDSECIARFSQYLESHRGNRYSSSNSRLFGFSARACWISVGVRSRPSMASSASE